RQLAELRENDRLFQLERRREARFRSLVQQGNDVLLVVGGGGTILYRSPSAERLPGLGVTPATLAGLFDAKGAAALQGLVEDPSRVNPLPIRFAGPQGGLAHLEFIATDLRGDPAVRGVLLTGRDVSERKALEDELLHAQKIRAVAQMAGGLAHDLNNILTA